MTVCQNYRWEKLEFHDNNWGWCEKRCKYVLVTACQNKSWQHVWKQFYDLPIKQFPILPHKIDSRVEYKLRIRGLRHTVTYPTKDPIVYADHLYKKNVSTNQPSKMKLSNVQLGFAKCILLLYTRSSHNVNSLSAIFN